MPPRRGAAATQIALLSLVFFCCPGLFSALSSIAGGLQDAAVAFRGNVLIYVSYSLAGVAAAALLPAEGVRASLSLGSLGYLAYVLAVWNLSLSPVSSSAESAFYAASVLLGVAAGFLWTAQGQMIMSYSTSSNQGRYLSAFWIVFNLGAAGGGLLTCLLNWKAQENENAEKATARQAASHATFAAFAVLTAVGVAVAVAWIEPPNRVVREDGTPVGLRVSKPLALPEGSWRADAAALLAYAFSSRDVLLLLPFFVYSNWFYTYHALFNVSVFNTRSSGLASACYWAAQMLAAHFLGAFLDAPPSSLPSTESTGRFVQSLQLAYTRPLALDIVDDARAAAWPLVLYVVYGAGDALGQVWVYWYVSSVCPRGREPRIAGFNAGIYKSVQSLSAAAAWYIGAQRVAPARQLAVNWALANAAVLGAALSLRGNRPARREHALLDTQDSSQEYQSVAGGR